MPPEQVEQVKSIDHSRQDDPVGLLDSLFWVESGKYQVQKFGLTHASKSDSHHTRSQLFSHSSELRQTAGSILDSSGRALKEFSNAAVYASIEEPLLGLKR